MTETPAADLPVLVIDGATFRDFEGFQRAFSAFLNDYEWHGNLDAFDDILSGGFGTPESGWILRWLNSDLSREALGYDAAARGRRGRRRCSPRTSLMRFEARAAALSPRLRVPPRRKEERRDCALSAPVENSPPSAG